jgi:FtsZ-interacting cell division protein ZipA
VLASLWAKPAVKIGTAIVALLAIAGLVFGALWYVDHVRAEGFEAGKTSCESQVKSNTIIIQREIQRAEEHGPRTRRDASDRLRKHSF